MGTPRDWNKGRGGNLEKIDIEKTREIYITDRGAG